MSMAMVDIWQMNMGVCQSFVSVGMLVRPWTFSTIVFMLVMFVMKMFMFMSRGGMRVKMSMIFFIKGPNTYDHEKSGNPLMGQRLLAQ